MSSTNELAIAPNTYEINPAPSFVDTELSNMVAGYLDGLQNGERTRFRALSFSDKTDEMCWIWAQNPETTEASIELKSLVLVKALTDPIYEHDTEKPKDRHIPTCDPYWAAVDGRVEAYLQRQAEHEFGMAMPLPELDMTEDQESDHFLLATIRDFNIYKQYIVYDNQLVHTHYVTAHASLASEIA